MRGRGGEGWVFFLTQTLPQGGFLWGAGQPHILLNLCLEGRGSSNFLHWESVVGLKRLGVFRVNRQRRGSFSAGGGKGSQGAHSL